MKKLVIVILVLLILSLLVIDNIYTNKAVNTCINNNVDIKVCYELYNN